jgi:hypothetical protein
VPLLIAWIVTGAAWLFVHVVALYLVLRADGLERGWKAASLVPLVTPIAAWKAKKQAAAVAWVVCGAVYLVLRALG